MQRRVPHPQRLLCLRPSEAAGPSVLASVGPVRCRCWRRSPLCQSPLRLFPPSSPSGPLPPTLAGARQMPCSINLQYRGLSALSRLSLLPRQAWFLAWVQHHTASQSLGACYQPVFRPTQYREMGRTARRAVRSGSHASTASMTDVSSPTTWPCAETSVGMHLALVSEYQLGVVTLTTPFPSLWCRHAATLQIGIRPH